MRSIILSSLNKCHDQMADDPESTTDPEPEPRPETISDPPAEFRKRSEPKRCRPRSGAETGNDFRSVKPNPGINPEPNIDITSTSLSPSPIRSQSPNPTLIRSRDRNRIGKTSRLSAKRHFIFIVWRKKEERQSLRIDYYEERKKMTDFVHKKDGWLADYYLEENFWRFLFLLHLNKWCPLRLNVEELKW